jgi:hypothetical protein
MLPQESLPESPVAFHSRDQPEEAPYLGLPGGQRGACVQEGTGHIRETWRAPGWNPG